MGARCEAQPMHPERSGPGKALTGSPLAPIRPDAGRPQGRLFPAKRPAATRGCADRRRPTSRSRAAGRPASARKANRGTCADWQSERIKGESDPTWHRAAISADKLLF